MQLIHKEIHVPDDASLYFIGDIHGCWDLLQKALKAVNFDHDKDHLVCVGDLIDRGPDNLKVFSKFVYGDNRFHTVLGNHDQFWAYNKEGNNFGNWIYNGGRWILDEGLDDVQLDAIASDIRSKVPVFLTVYHRGNIYGVVHGAIPNIYQGNGTHDYDKYGNNLIRNWFDVVKDMETFITPDMADRYIDREISYYTWDRNVIKGIKDGVVYPPVMGVDYTFHGHTFVDEPIQHGNRVYIDTGGVFTNNLTIAKIEREKVLTFSTEVGKWIPLN